MISPDEMREIHVELTKILDEAVADWTSKREDYGDAFLELGAKGQFSEMWRKIKKLQRTVWYGYALRGEDAEQIAKEIIPHCMMMIYCLRNPRGLDQMIPQAGSQTRDDLIP